MQVAYAIVSNYTWRAGVSAYQNKQRWQTKLHRRPFLCINVICSAFTVQYLYIVSENPVIVTKTICLR